MVRAVKPYVIFLVASAALACGGAGDHGEGDPQEGGPTLPAASCTGAVPSNSTMCPDSDAGLTIDTPRVVIGSSCFPATPCSYICNTGFVASAGGCVSAPDTSPAFQFTDNEDGTVTVTDAGGRLTWLRDVNCGGTGSWEEAVAWSAGLADGACSLRDGSVQGAWRLPTHVELARMALALAAGNPFPSVEPGNYWSSWVYWPHKAGAVELFSGNYFDYERTQRFYVWPVRSP